jgi:hypothetical protein
VTESRPGEQRRIPADEARQGEIILRKRWQRIVFIAGLAGFVLFILFGSLVYANGFLGAGLPGK